MAIKNHIQIDQKQLTKDFFFFFFFYHY
jgi:hypothetical protein